MNIGICQQMLIFTVFPARVSILRSSCTNCSLRSKLNSVSCWARLLALPKRTLTSVASSSSTSASLDAPVHAEARPVNLIEGSYACHPALWDLYDLHVFLSVGPEEQHRRIAARNGEKMLPMFTNVWIPMEETYFARFQVAERADLCREN